MSELVQIERTSRRMAWALDTVAAPALFLVFQDSIDNLAAPLAICRTVTEHVSILNASGINWVKELIRSATGDQQDEIEVVAGGLSSIPANERPGMNAARERILAIGRKLVIVEPAARASELYRDFPDIMSCMRDTFRFESPLFEGDENLDSGSTWRLETIARRLPPVVTRGSTLIVSGQVHAKVQPLIPCPKCGGALERGLSTILFQHAPVETREQRVSGWVCVCGEAYIPGEVARAAHARAFRR